VLSAVAQLLPSPRIAAHAASGVLWVGYDGDGAPIDAVREQVAAYDGQVVVVHAPPEVKRSVDVWGPARGLEVMRRIKDRFDPGHRLAPHTFVGGI
jgi:glycolate oxidase FAD binding subunit